MMIFGSFHCKFFIFATYVMLCELKQARSNEIHPIIHVDQKNRNKIEKEKRNDCCIISLLFSYFLNSFRKGSSISMSYSMDPR